MTEPTALERRITDALGTVREARQAYAHSPSASNEGLLTSCQERLDELMDEWSADHTAGGMVTA